MIRTPALESSRILVIGPPGSGKTTFSTRLASTLGFEHINLDALGFTPDCSPQEKLQHRDRLHTLMQKDSWIIDGNYPVYFRVGLEHPDTIILLDRSVHLCIARVLKRGWQRSPNRQQKEHDARTNDGQQTANVQRFHLFRRLRKINYRRYWDLINFSRLYRPMMLANLRDWTGEPLIILHTDEDVAAFLATQSLPSSQHAGVNGVR